MKKLLGVFAIIGAVLYPVGANAGEKVYTWLMQIGPLQRLQEEHGPVSSPPVIDIQHFSVDALAHACLAATLLILLVLFGARRIRNRKQGEGLIPDEGLTMKNIWELAVENLFNLVKDPLGEKNARRFFPFLGTLFIYIFISNIMGLIPGFIPPTSNININAGMAISVFVYYNYAGFREHGISYLKHFLGPVLWMAPLMILIEVISNVVRVLSLSMRLFGNIHGDHMVLEIFTDLTKLGVPVIFLGLGLFVSFIQALVFTLLSTIYFQLALAHEH